MAAAEAAATVQPAGMAAAKAATTTAGEHGDDDATHAGEHAICRHGDAGSGIWPAAESWDGHGNAHGVPFLTVRGEQE